MARPATSETAGWDQCTNILCVRPDNMGDVLMTTPAFRALKQRFPGCRLTLLTSSAGALVSPSIAALDDTIIFDVPWVKNGATHDAGAVTAMARTLRDRHFDAAILFTTYSQNPLPAAMLCYMAGISRVAGYCRENPYALISDWLPDPEPLETIRHEVERQLDLVASLGSINHKAEPGSGLTLAIGQPARDSALDTLCQQGLDPSKPWLILHAGVSEAKRRYPAEDFAAAIRQMLAEDWQIVLTGSPDERSYVANLTDLVGQDKHAQGKRLINIAGQLSVEELAAAISLSRLLIANNTGPVHLAAAVGTPVVVLYAMTNPQHTPWQVANRVLYFPVPAALRSKNRFLQSFPGPSEPMASPQAIAEAVHQLMAPALMPQMTKERH